MALEGDVRVGQSALRDLGHEVHVRDAAPDLVAGELAELGVDAALTGFRLYVDQRHRVT